MEKPLKLIKKYDTGKWSMGCWTKEYVDYILSGKALDKQFTVVIDETEFDYDKAGILIFKEK